MDTNPLYAGDISANIDTHWDHFLSPLPKKSSHIDVGPIGDFFIRALLYVLIVFFLCIVVIIPIAFAVWLVKKCRESIKTRTYYEAI